MTVMPNMPRFPVDIAFSSDCAICASHHDCEDWHDKYRITQLAVDTAPRDDLKCLHKSSDPEGAS
jgi:hypothetical protein